MPKDLIPADYDNFLHNLKKRIQEVQIQAALSVNRELILLYWHIGHEIVERQQQQGWGKKVIDQLSHDLHQMFPQMKGFSPRNLGYMKVFAQLYPDEIILQQVVAKIPWGHHCILLDKVKDADERLWYINWTIRYGWSRNILAHQIDLDLYHRQGKAITNFSQTLPPIQSDLAQETLKDPYMFDFLNLTQQVQERELQNALLAHIRDFLLELGAGFTFVGDNYHLQVGGEDFYLDLLFYHLHLRCYVVIDLKTGEFRPEYAGKMNFYLTAVNELLKHPDDKPTIGMLLCRTQNKIIAEYALKDIQAPLGVATYQLTTDLPEMLKGILPEIEEIEATLSKPETKQ